VRRGLAALLLTASLALSGCAADGSVDAAKACQITITIAQAVLSNCK